MRLIRIALGLVAAVGSAGCGTHDDLAAILVGASRDAGALDPDAPPEFDVIGRPWEGRWPFRVASWPLERSLEAFFTMAVANGAQVSVAPSDRGPLWRLRVAVADGEYGPSRNAVVAEDAGGSQYLLVFPADV